jgi:hypothetical protein
VGVEEGGLLEALVEGEGSLLPWGLVVLEEVAALVLEIIVGRMKWLVRQGGMGLSMYGFI